MYFNDKLMFFQMDFEDQTTCLTFLANQLFNEGYVKESYIDSIIKRENSYPTGLLVDGIGIAIPHTDSSCVLKSQITFMNLKKPIVFSLMTDVTTKIEVNLIFMLALKNSAEQLDSLKYLSEIFQKKSVLEQMKICASSGHLFELLKTNYLEMEGDYNA